MNKIINVILILFIGCNNSTDNNESKIETTLYAKKRVQELIDNNIISAAEIFNSSNLDKNSEQKFIYLDSTITGINFNNIWNPDPIYEAQLGNSFIAAGVAIGDYDNDGLQDIFLSRQQDGGKLYRNLGEFQFSDVTVDAGIISDGMWSTGVSFIDINGDGWLDLYVCGFDSRNRLYINHEGKFIESAKKYGLDFKGASVSMAFSDFDRDGDIDAYLLTNRLESTDLTANAKIINDKNKPLQVHPDSRELGYFVKPPGRVPILINAGQYDYLYRNDNGYFVDITAESGIGKNPYYGLSSTWWDYNNDGWPDLYVANDYMGPDHLFENQGLDSSGSIKFIDIAVQSLPYTPWFSMGSDYSDINNDGKMDLMASDMAGSNHYRDKVSMGSMSGPDSDAWFLNFPDPPQYMRNVLYLNTGTDRFMEVAYLNGLAATDWTWTVKFGDLDNDGFEDVYFTNGMSRDFVNGDLKDRFRTLADKNKNIFNESGLMVYWKDEEPYRLSNLAYKNLGNLKFEDVSSKWNLDYFGVSTGSALGDLDKDGDLDIIMNGFNEPVRVYRNDVSKSNAIRILLISDQKNSQSFGSRIEIEYDEQSKKMFRYVSSSRGFMSSSESVVHFGLGKYDRADKVIIHWASGAVQVLRDIPSGYLYKVTEKETENIPSIQKEKMFKKDTGPLADIKHREKFFDDFNREKLLPNKLSQLGSGVTWGDVDGDGDDDIYIGGASGFPGKIYVNDKSNFFSKGQQAFIYDAGFEDMGALFIDPDRDNDLDLYVVSGGVECSPGSSLLNDRIYFNDGKGNFSKGFSSLLPKLRNSGGVIVTADINRNGRLEIFIGGRVIPGEYPSTPISSILQNSGKNYIDVTNEIAPEIKQSGMVTSAMFSDVDNDNWPDLLVTYEWGPVRFFHNEQGTLIDRTNDVGLFEKFGWFNSISGGDIDNDGDTDFVIGNTGYNTKYKASIGNPEILFYGDFEGTGKKNIVEAKYEEDICFPRRGLGCSSDAMPIIKEKFPTYHEFAISSVNEIYSPELLSSADRYEVNELASGILFNNTDSTGNIEFVFKALPRIVQSSPVFGSTICDVNGDGNLDIYVVQNFSGPQRETGYMHGGVSQLLLGDGSGTFEPIPPDESGLIVPGDATTLTTHDFNDDNRVDFLVGVNDGKFESFINQINAESISLRLPDFPRGKRYIGSKVWVYFNDNSLQLHEVFGGEGYLSHSAPIVFIGNVKGIKKVIIEWPDGFKEKIDIYKDLISLKSS